MSTTEAVLQGFAYGEDLEALSQRSLGYRLLAPVAAAPWSAEVEALARRLQAAPYPDHWPPTDLFCSVLLADGRRLVAVVRYGLADHTSSHRRGGLEMLGMVGPADLDVRAALAAYRWLQQRRSQADDLHRLGGEFSLADIVAADVPPAPSPDPVPILPVRLWQEGALLFAATTPSDPDHHLGLLEQNAGRSWQWLPLVGPDFPLLTYAQRGALIAWTPHLAGVAVKLESKTSTDRELPRDPKQRKRTAFLVGAAVALLIGLLAGNLWALLSVRQRLDAQPAAPAGTGPATLDSAPATKGAENEEPRERFAAALHDLLLEPGSPRDWSQSQGELLARYERLSRHRKDLALRDGNTKGKLAVGAASVLAQRNAGRVEDAVRRALLKKGYDPELVKLACDRIHEQLTADVKDNP